MSVASAWSLVVDDTYSRTAGRIRRVHLRLQVVQWTLVALDAVVWLLEMGALARVLLHHRHPLHLRQTHAWMKRLS